MMKCLMSLFFIATIVGCSSTPNSIVSDFGCEYRDHIFDRGLPIFDGKASFECDKIDDVYRWIKTS